MKVLQYLNITSKLFGYVFTTYFLLLINSTETDICFNFISSYLLATRFSSYTTA